MTAASSSLSLSPKLKIMMVFCIVSCLMVQVQGCVCPSCSQADGTERCMCCVYRQLGKRSWGDTPNSRPRPNTAQEPTAMELKQAPQQDFPISGALPVSPFPVSRQRESPMLSIFRGFPLHLGESGVGYFQALLDLTEVAPLQDQRQEDVYDKGQFGEIAQG